MLLFIKLFLLENFSVLFSLLLRVMGPRQNSLTSFKGGFVSSLHQLCCLFSCWSDRPALFSHTNSLLVRVFLVLFLAIRLNSTSLKSGFLWISSLVSCSYHWTSNDIFPAPSNTQKHRNLPDQYPILFESWHLKPAVLSSLLFSTPEVSVCYVVIPLAPVFLGLLLLGLAWEFCAMVTCLDEICKSAYTAKPCGLK